MERGKRRSKEGVVVGRKMDKTAVVQTERVMMHPRYHKTVRIYKKFLVHDPENQTQVGDVVVIAETRRISASKSHRIVKVLGKSKVKTRELPKKKEKEEEKDSDTAAV